MVDKSTSSNDLKVLDLIYQLNNSERIILQTFKPEKISIKFKPPSTSPGEKILLEISIFPWMAAGTGRRVILEQKWKNNRP